MKKWTQHQASNGLAVNPPLVNDELTAQQSSATTLDRAQLPASWVDAARLKDGALHQAWEASLFPAGGEQTTEVDAIVPPMGWMSSTLQIQSGGWTSISPSPILLTGFRGGNLFLEWSCNAWVNNIFIHGLNDGKPYSPNYMRLRAVVNGTVVRRFVRHGSPRRWSHPYCRTVPPAGGSRSSRSPQTPSPPGSGPQSKWRHACFRLLRAPAVAAPRPFRVRTIVPRMDPRCQRRRSRVGRAPDRPPAVAGFDDECDDCRACAFRG